MQPDPSWADEPDRAAMVETALAAAERDPRNLPAVLHAANVCFGAGRPDEAIRLARAALALGPEDFPALRTLSGFLAATGALAEAEALADRAVAARPQDVEARVHAAGLLLHRGRPEAAVATLAVPTHATALGPVGLRLLSGAFAALGRIGPALEAIDAAIALRPEETEYRLHRASLLGSRARHGDALAELAIAAAAAPGDPRVPLMASAQHEALGDLAAAHEAANLAARLAPLDPEARQRCERLADVSGLMRAAGAAGTAVPHVRLPRRRAEATPPPGLAGLVAERWRVVHALMLRDMRTRFSRSYLGYFWAVFEPISHLLTLGVMFYLINQGPPPVGRSLFGFYASGLIPYLMFAHIATEVMQARGTGGAVLLLPRVSTIDVMLARTLLTLATEIVVGLIVFSAFVVLGLAAAPTGLLRCAEATALLALLGLGIGAINLVVHEVMHAWETLFAAVVRLLYFGSGIYYSPIYMPDFARRILEWNPVLQGVEFFRTGFFHGYHPFWVHPRYLLAWVGGALLIGFALERGMRRRLRRPA